MSVRYRGGRRVGREGRWTRWTRWTRWSGVVVRPTRPHPTRPHPTHPPTPPNNQTHRVAVVLLLQHGSHLVLLVHGNLLRQAPHIDRRHILRHGLLRSLHQQRILVQLKRVAVLHLIPRHLDRQMVRHKHQPLPLGLAQTRIRLLPLLVERRQGPAPLQLGQRLLARLERRQVRERLPTELHTARPLTMVTTIKDGRGSTVDDEGREPSVARNATLPYALSEKTHQVRRCVRSSSRAPWTCACPDASVLSTSKVEYVNVKDGLGV